MLISGSSGAASFYVALHLTGRGKGMRRKEKVWLRNRKGRVHCEKGQETGPGWLGSKVAASHSRSAQFLNCSKAFLHTNAILQSTVHCWLNGSPPLCHIATTGVTDCVACHFSFCWYLLTRKGQAGQKREDRGPFDSVVTQLLDGLWGISLWPCSAPCNLEDSNPPSPDDWFKTKQKKILSKWEL